MNENDNHNPIENLVPPTSKEVDQAWENVISRIRIHEREKRRKKIFKYSIAASAAVILMIGSLVGYHTFFKPDIYLAEQSNSSIKLSDGTMVTLFKGARLTVEKSFPSDTREVQLQGDALFEVAKSKEHPFIVHGLNYETKVLGTVFKVMQDGSTFKVDLFDGQVAIKKANTKEEYFLTPNKTFNNYGKPDVAAITPLKEHTVTMDPYKAHDSMIRLSFSECSIKNAIEVVEKTYHVKVEYPAQYADRKISLDNVNVSPAAILGTISAHLDLKLNIYDTTYRLEK
ncbi:FecR family protein [Chryseobacterium herbae]|uniref:FecR family protein n=1 Tax=Chryseobacterium herbae TaxID=2976476 RepID=A0ABT2ISL7_9FLAO|nr:FecR family protein [Chryseobacterium sp. pc1-10]MCT2561826.1 FecR family protein [Chryseobacterium sp. pc1-10]